MQRVSQLLVRKTLWQAFAEQVESASYSPFDKDHSFDAISSSVRQELDGVS